MRRLAARICLQRPAGETNHRLANNQFFHRLFVGEVYSLRAPTFPAACEGF
jgi:hypothetical protein